MGEYVIVFLMILLWCYLSTCLFLIAVNSGFYTQSIPLIDTNGTYQIHSFIPFGVFTDYFNKKVYE